MERKKLRAAFLFCLVLFALALILAWLFPGDGHGPAGSPLIFSEVFPANRVLPAPNGLPMDLIELQNTGKEPLDLSGWQLADQPDEIGFTFPLGTTVEPGGFALCWCSRDNTDPAFGTFGISARGKDLLYLYDAKGVLLEKLDLPAVPENHAYARQADGTWAVTDQGTPGFSNDSAGYDRWLHSLGPIPQVEITEVMAANTCTALPDGSAADWVELQNVGDAPADLSGAWLSDDPDAPLGWQLPDLVLEPGGFCVIPCGGRDHGPGQADFALVRSGCTVLLTGPLGNALARLDCPAMGEDQSCAKTDSGYALTDAPTPGYENSPAGHGDWRNSLPPAPTVRFSEIVISNRSIPDFYDWIELENFGDSPADLSGCFLSDDPGRRSKWQIPALQLQPGQRTVIFCAGDAATAEQADFALSRSGCTLSLSSPQGQMIDRLTVPALRPDHSFSLQEDGLFRETVRSTPGFPNTLEGYHQFCDSLALPAGLLISEVMTSNSRFLPQPGGETPDFVELENRGASPVNLRDYALSNDWEDPLLFPLPDQVLQPGETAVILCADPLPREANLPCAPFHLSREADWVYLSDQTGQILDCFRAIDLPANQSAGRQPGSPIPCLFPVPSPGVPNGPGDPDALWRWH